MFQKTLFSKDGKVCVALSNLAEKKFSFGGGESFGKLDFNFWAWIQRQKHF